MKIDELVKSIKDKFGDKVLNAELRGGRKAYIGIAPEDIAAFTGHLFKVMGLRFVIATAIDEFDAIEMLYHFSLDSCGLVVSLRTFIKDKEDPHIDTITTITRGAWWIEREIHELFGVHFNGNSDLRPLLLPDDWPDGVYPLRKNFVVPKRDSRKI